MSYYETVFIIRQDVSDKYVDDLVSNYSKIIADNGGKVARTEKWGLRSLAFKIRKNRKGHYILMHIDAEHAAIAEMERQMRLSEDIIRILTLKIAEIPAEGTIMMKSNSYDRDDKPARSGGY